MTVRQLRDEYPRIQVDDERWVLDDETDGVPVRISFVFAADRLLPPRVAERAVWYADVPNKRGVRVREGGEVLNSIDVDRGCFACMLGGPEKSTLFVVAAEWRGMEKIPEVARARTGLVLSAKASAPGVGWP
jgi:hypothetical protein